MATKESNLLVAARTGFVALVGAVVGFVACRLMDACQFQRRRGCQPSQVTTQTVKKPNVGPDGSCGKAPVRQGRASELRELLSQGRIIAMPCCYDGLTARLVERAGFELTFMTGFGVSAVNGYPDCQLVSYQEMVHAAFSICGALNRICCIGDGDTGYGNAINVMRTVRGYAQAGMAGIMIEDQVAPKRCGHTTGKAVVPRSEAVARLKAACDARDEGMLDICIMARTDARATDGLEEALERCKAFVEAGADITFLEAPESEEEMMRYCREVPGPKMANMLPSGKTPILPLWRLEEMGYTIAAYPLLCLSSGLKGQLEALQKLKQDMPTSALEIDFETLKDVVGFPEYYQQEARYRT